MWTPLRVEVALWVEGVIRGTPDLDEAREFSQFPIYFVGESFEGLPLTRAPENVDPIAVRQGRQALGFSYGSCVPTGNDGGCGLPLEIQNFSICKRNPSLYGITPNGETPAHMLLEIRGAAAAMYANGGPLELYTGQTTVVIFAERDLALRAAASLRPPDQPDTTTMDDLPPPAAGALEGEPVCGEGS